jgi:hypothetical protein
MVASYSVEGDSFSADKPRRWSDARLDVRPRGFVSVPDRLYDVHPDACASPDRSSQRLKWTPARNHVVLIFNFFDDLKRIAP